MKEWDSEWLTYELLNFEAVDNFSHKVRDFVSASDNLGAHQFKFNYCAQPLQTKISLSLNNSLIKCLIQFRDLLDWLLW